MRFRPGRVDDLDWCMRAVESDGGLSVETAQGLPAFWQQLIAANALAGFAILESDESPPGDQRAGFAMSAFAREAFVRDLWGKPAPYFVSELLELERRGQSALLTFDEVRAANSTSGLHLVILHTVFRHPDLTHPETRRLIPVIGYAFFHAHAGYRLLSITGEYYGEQVRDFMVAGGYRVVEDFASVGASWTSLNRPVLVRRLREEAIMAPHDQYALHLFHPESPRFFFTPAEQRVLLQAVLGASDRQIAAELDLSTETVRTVWDAVYARVSRTSSTLLSGVTASTDGASGARGAEKRRELLEYLRQHMEELRPVLRPR